jgi:Putative adhesin
MSHWDFARSEPVEAYLHVISGSIKIVAAPTETITVDLKPCKPGHYDDELTDRFTVELVDDRLEVSEPTDQGSWLRHSAGFNLRVTIPIGSCCLVNTVSASVECTGELGALDAKTASGSVQADTITGPVQLNTVSGRIKISDIAESVTAKTASGRVELDRVGGDINVGTVSGRIGIGVAEASVAAQTATGRVQIDRLMRGTAEVSTVSGAIEANVAPGTGIYLDLASISGRVTSELEPSQSQGEGEVDLSLRCRSASGSIKVGRAVLADA